MKQKWNGAFHENVSENDYTHTNELTASELSTQEYDLDIASSLVGSITIFVANT
jgi:hypothetical protein